MFAPDVEQQSAEDQLVDSLAETLYVLARQVVKNEYEHELQTVSNE